MFTVSSVVRRIKNERIDQNKQWELEEELFKDLAPIKILENQHNWHNVWVCKDYILQETIQRNFKPVFDTATPSNSYKTLIPKNVFPKIYNLKTEF